MTTYTMKMIRDEVAELCRDGDAPTDREERKLWAEHFLLDYGWDGIVQQVAGDAALQRDLERLIKDALLGYDSSSGRHAAMLKLGKIIVGLAEEHSAREVGDMIEDALNTEPPQYGYDVPETQRQSLDRSAA